MSFKSCTMWSQIKIPMREGRVLCCQSSGGSDSSDYLSYWVQIDSWYHGVQAPDLAANGLLVKRGQAGGNTPYHVLYLEHLANEWTFSRSHARHTRLGSHWSQHAAQMYFVDFENNIIDFH